MGKTRGGIYRLVGVALAVALVAAACSDDADDTTTTAAEATTTTAAAETTTTQAEETTTSMVLEALSVGFIVDQSGPLAPIGEGYIRGTEAAAEYWNADEMHRPIEVTTCDSQSTGEGALACYRQLEGSGAIVGPHLFVGLASVQEIAESEGPPLLAAMPFSEAAPDSFVFQTLPNIDDAVAVGMEYLASQGITSVATLTSNDAPGNIAMAAAAAAAPEQGIELVAQESFDPTAQNLTPQAEAIAAANPEAVFTWAVGPPLVPTLRALGTAGLNVPTVNSFASMTIPLLQAAGEEAPEELLFVGFDAFDPESIDDAAYKEFVETYNGVYQGINDQLPDLPAYVAADAVLYAAAAGQAAESPDVLKSTLQSGEDLPSLAFATYSYSEGDHIGLPGRAFRVLLWDPANVAFVVPS